MLLFFLGLGISVNAQEKFEDLEKLYLEGKYEKLVEKAENYTDKDKWKKHPVPYVFCSMGHYEIAKDIEFREEYPKAQANALKFAAKFRRVDKKDEFFDKYAGYLTELKEYSLETAQESLEESEWSLALRIYKYINVFNPEDGSVWLLRAYCEARMKQPNDANNSMNEAFSALNEESPDSIIGTQKTRLKYGIFNFSDYLVGEGKSDSAKTTLNLGLKYLENDDEYATKIKEVGKQ